ncbi:DUF1559 domain-containing protein [Planctomycetota bacterium]
MSTAISVIVPTLNEGGNIEHLVRRVHMALSGSPISYELLIVDDRSEDNTLHVARRLSESYPLRVISRQGARDLSQAVCDGIEAARGGICVVMDADLSHPPEQIIDIITPLNDTNVNMVVGSRYSSGGYADSSWPAHRRIISALATFPVRCLTAVKDPMSGFFAIRHSAFDRVRSHITPKGFKIGFELLSFIDENEVCEVPITFSNRSSGSTKLRSSVVCSFGLQVLRHTRRNLFSKSERTLATADKRKQLSSGIALIEVLITVALIGLLVSILFPALNSAREAARRLECTSKIRNLSIAVIAHHDAHQHFPRSRFKVPDDVGPNTKSWSWIVKVLPFIEEHQLFDDLQVHSATLSEKPTYVSRPLAFLRCPSDGISEFRRTGVGGFEEVIVAPTSYKAVSGANWGSDETIPTSDIGTLWRVPSVTGSFDGQAFGDGVMWRDDFDMRMNASEITDGLSKTFLLGEDVPEYNLWNSWAYTNNVFGTCAIPLNYNNSHPAWWPNSMGFRSEHPGVAVFSKADGSVAIVSASVDLGVFRASATRAGSDNVSVLENYDER